MKIKPLHDPAKGKLRVVGFMSGAGSNLRKILDNQDGYEVVAIFTDCCTSRACEIGKDFDIPVICRDVQGFYKRSNRPRGDLKIRAVFDLQTVGLLQPFRAQLIAYAGYMSIVTKPLLDNYLGINVHPADLSIEENGRRKYVGGWALRAALEAGEQNVRSTTHIVEPTVDGGRILMLSEPVSTVGIKAHIVQELLKERGDHVIFPLTLQYIAGGRYGQDAKGRLYFDQEPIPRGVWLGL